MLGVCPIDGKAQRRPVLPALEPRGHDIGNQIGLVHRVGQVAFVVVAGEGADTG
jgi:hypothetical protein